MSDRDTVQPSKSQVNKAGKILRRLMQDQLASVEDVRRSLDVLIRFRAAHQYPLTKATMGLRSMVKTEGCRINVSQRLKRLPTILDKLTREPTLQLGNMQDIGGCRAVLDTVDDVRRVQRRMHRNGRVERLADYIKAPRESGYRGVHVITRYDGRAIEVQLRTLAQHEWAIAVENLGGRIEHDLKSGNGPPAVIDLLRVVSEAMAMEEAGRTVDDDLHSEIKRLRRAAAPWLRGSP